MNEMFDKYLSSSCYHCTSVLYIILKYKVQELEALGGHCLVICGYGGNVFIAQQMLVVS